jgi:superfamily II DNA/RNA helicase
MNNPKLQATLEDLNVSSFIQNANDATLARMVAAIQSEDTQQPTPEKLFRYALFYEKQGIYAFKRFISNPETTKREDLFQAFQPAYTCWRTLTLLPDDTQQGINGHVSTQGIHLVGEEAEDEEESLPPELTLAFHLAITGLLSGRYAEARLDLKRFSLSEPSSIDDKNWNSSITKHIFRAFVLLVRKANGWRDVQQALQSISTLRQIQERYEEAYLKALDGVDQRTEAAFELVGLYNLAQLITLVGRYLQSGEPAYASINTSLDHHYDQAIEALEESGQLLLAHLADLLWAGCRELVQNAIWTHVRRSGKDLRDYINRLTLHNHEHPVIELWPSQQEALHNHLLDSYPQAILIQMPTSAGKTLLAKFTIIQTKALNPESLVVYIVPTRALVNQVTLDLKTDFQPLWSVEQTVPVFEIDPTEEKLLESQIGVLVTTPEKLDLLVRSNHPVVKDVALVVADEAHNLGDGERGARLELLLGTIKRDFANARFLLLSPFMPNSQDILQWLSEDLSSVSIQVDWKPNRKIVGAIHSVRKQPRPLLELETLDSIHNDVRGGMKIIIGETPATGVQAISRATAHSLVGRGSVLVLCRGLGTAEKRAKEIAEERPALQGNEALNAVCHYVEAEMGKDCDLVYVLRRGVAYHHSGLSQETRWLIEGLIRDRIVEIVCGTTTLAQGVNFPITTVIVEDLRKGRAGKLSVQDFWNIAGRAGRALVDTLGVVVMPVASESKQEEFAGFLKKEAEKVASQLVELIERANWLSTLFNLSFLERNPGWSPLFQFLAHAMRVSGKENLADEVEDLLRASLVYHQVRKRDQELARKLIQICRAYIEQTNEHKNILGLADKTGFATPSVLSLLAKKTRDKELAFPGNWRPEHLFGEDLKPLSKRIELIADLPEIRLAQKTLEGIRRPGMSSMAEILRDWVHGKTIEEMAHLYGKPGQESSKQIAEFSKDLFSVISLVSWGIGALETVCLSSDERTDWGNVGYVPSMIYFGVSKREATWLRMAGVPRVVASNLAQLWRTRVHGDPTSYESIRTWVTHLSDKEWQQALPAETSLTPRDMRFIWHSLSGER